MHHPTDRITIYHGLCYTSRGAFLIRGGGGVAIG